MDSSSRKLIIVAVTAILLTAGVMTVFGGSSSGASESEITITGSTTLQPIMVDFKEQYEKETVGVTLTITGGGSGGGIVAAGQGTHDIGMTSRDVRASELASYPDMQVHVIGKDGVAIIVGSSVATAGITDLTRAQVEGIYNGTYTNWNQLGGPDQTITKYTRDTASGTRDCFDSTVMKNSDISLDTLVTASNSQMKTDVNNNPWSIGYVGLAFIDGTNPLDIGGVSPTAANVANGDYEIQRNLILVTGSEPSEWTAAFMEWIMQPTAQQILANKGFVPLAA